MTENTLPATPFVTAPASPRARWIVYGTLACWIIFACVMGYLFAASPAPDDEDPTSRTTTIFLLLGALPGYVTGGLAFLLMRGDLPDAMGWIFVFGVSIVFAGLEIYAWWRRVNWLAVTLLVWLGVNMAFIVVVYFMSLSNDPGV